MPSCSVFKTNQVILVLPKVTRVKCLRNWQLTGVGSVKHKRLFIWWKINVTFEAVDTFWLIILEVCWCCDHSRSDHRQIMSSPLKIHPLTALCLTLSVRTAKASCFDCAFESLLGFSRFPNVWLLKGPQGSWEIHQDFPACKKNLTLYKRHKDNSSRATEAWNIVQIHCKKQELYRW